MQNHTWSERYRFKKEMLPSFVAEDFGRKVCVQMAGQKPRLGHVAEMT